MFETELGFERPQTILVKMARSLSKQVAFWMVNYYLS